MASMKKYTMFCKVCFDAGKTEVEFTSHYPRVNPSSDAKIVCPTLLSLSCKYCKKNGHTPKYCPTLKQKQEHFEERQVSSSSRHVPLFVKKQGNRVVVEDCVMTVSIKSTLSKKETTTPHLIMGNTDVEDKNLTLVPRQVKEQKKNANMYEVLCCSSDDEDEHIETTKEVGNGKRSASAKFWSSKKDVLLKDDFKQPTKPQKCDFVPLSVSTTPSPSTSPSTSTSTSTSQSQSQSQKTKEEIDLLHQLEEQEKEMMELRRKLEVIKQNKKEQEKEEVISELIKKSTVETKPTSTIVKTTVTIKSECLDLYCSDISDDDEPGWGDLCMEDDM